MTTRSRLRHVRQTLLLLSGSAALAAGTVVASAAPPAAAASLPCDIYAAGGTPCVAAYSTTRALYASYSGPLYQVRRSSDSATLNVAVSSAGGVVNVAPQDSFCAGTTCVITTVYDQSGRGNNLQYEGPGGAGGNDTAAVATTESLTVGGHKAYSLYIKPGNGYWHNGSGSGMPLGSASQGAYMVTSGTHVNSGCCFDFGNSETDRKADGAGAMDAINFSTSCWFGGCSGSGPWVQADLEFGLYSGGSQSWNTNQRAFTSPYVTAILNNNGTTQMKLKGGNAQSGGLTTLYSGSLPPGYDPMKQQGAIDLGTGGDCCATNTNLSAGTFYEGAVVAGYPSDATDNAVQASIVAAGYGSGGGGATGPIVAGDNGAKCVDNNGGAASNGNKVQMWDCNGNVSSQSWTVASNGTLQIDGGCMDITGANYSNGTLIEWWPCNGGANQQWQATNGELVNPASGKCLDDPGSNTTNGTQLILWQCNGGANQQWHLP
jgi:non-reducing end alpha-L-arabinofuranosidase